jgi:hypothetical protein
MTEDGITRQCECCQKSYNCTDGSWFCSDECYDTYMSSEVMEED